MTYDWNKQVEITVPTGTNGWIYSGEVIINGVKVRFPVGVPTTVPEPAAALLNKMIELEREDENNTAKPDNHYVGSVTIPEGKTLTLQKGAKIVDENNAPVVILPETELRELNPGTQYEIPVSPDNAPTSGNTYKLTINGAEYNSPVASYTAGGMTAYVFGNSDLMGVTSMIGSNPNPDAPFVVVVSSVNASDDGEPDGYGTLVVSEITVEAPVTLSIVEAAKTESAGGGVLVINVTCDADDEMKTFTNATKDKTYAEAKAVYDAGGIVNARLEYKSGPLLGAKIEFPLKMYTSFDEMVAFMFGIPDGLGANTISIVNNDSLVVMID